MNAILKYPGSKWTLAERIVREMPSHKFYLEPFFGSGAVFFNTQSGDWINISRDLLRLIIESASGGQLRGQLIYTERYL